MQLQGVDLNQEMPEAGVENIGEGSWGRQDGDTVGMNGVCYVSWGFILLNYLVLHLRNPKVWVNILIPRPQPKTVPDLTRLGDTIIMVKYRPSGKNLI